MGISRLIADAPIVAANKEKPVESVLTIPRNIGPVPHAR
jgi:hypothetical protein